MLSSSTVGHNQLTSKQVTPVILLAALHPSSTTEPSHGTGLVTLQCLACHTTKVRLYLGGSAVRALVFVVDFLKVGKTPYRPGCVLIAVPSTMNLPFDGLALWRESLESCRCYVVVQVERDKQEVCRHQCHPCGAFSSSSSSSSPVVKRVILNLQLMACSMSMTRPSHGEKAYWQMHCPHEVAR